MAIILFNHTVSNGWGIDFVEIIGKPMDLLTIKKVLFNKTGRVDFRCITSNSSRSSACNFSRLPAFNFSLILNQQHITVYYGTRPGIVF